MEYALSLKNFNVVSDLAFSPALSTLRKYKVRDSWLGALLHRWYGSYLEFIIKALEKMVKTPDLIRCNKLTAIEVHGAQQRHSWSHRTSVAQHSETYSEPNGQGQARLRHVPHLMCKQSRSRVCFYDHVIKLAHSHWTPRLFLLCCSRCIKVIVNCFWSEYKGMYEGM